MSAVLVLLAAAVIAQPAAQGRPQNMVVNGSFEVDEDNDGVADGWFYAPGAPREQAPSVKLYREAGKVGKWCQVVQCTAFEKGHVMLAQTGTVAVEPGKEYEVSFWAKGRGLSRVNVAVQETKTWRHVGLWRSFRPPRRWRRFRFRFVANRAAHETTRLQFWFTSTGTLWLDDVAVVALGKPPAAEYVIRWPDGRKNCLPNASFELGPSGWMTYGYWRLWGRVVNERSVHGHRCLRIDADPERVPKAMFDYYEPSVRPLERLAAATKYWIELQPGRQYTFSAYARSNADSEVVIGVRFLRAEIPKVVKLPGDGEWHRFTLSFNARGGLAYVYCGPVLRPDARTRAIVWLDAFQLERGAEATAFEPRRQIEIAAEVEPWRQAGNRLPGLNMRVIAFNAGHQTAHPLVRWRATDFFGREIARGEVSPDVPAGRLATRDVVLTRDEVAFARVEVTAGAEALPVLRTAACAEPFGPGRTRFGINHAYGWDKWLDLARRIGVTWVRDWTLKWDWLEPERGKLNVAKGEPWIERIVRARMAPLCMFPFPSTRWAAENPQQRPKQERKLYRPIETAFRPTDLPAFKNYIRQCVHHYKDRVRHWEIFNESVFTSYSLPDDYGYTADDYVPLLRAAHQAIRAADERAFIIGGYSAPPSTGRRLYERMFALGGLAWCDAVSIHHYPGGEPEGLEDDLGAMVRMMKQAGAVRPMWLTEFAYYADDDPSQGRTPLRWPPLIESELAQALWTQRYCALALAGGVTHIFFHIWSTRPHFDSGAALFFEDDGEPRKVAATLLALVRMLGPDPQPVAQAGSVEDGRYVVVFRRADGQAVAMAWDAWAETSPAGPAPQGNWFDAVGRKLHGPPRKLDAAPVFVVGKMRPARLIWEMRRWMGL